MTGTLILATALAVVAIATKPAAAALPGYLGAFGTSRDALVNPAAVFVYTFDQHECEAKPTFANKITSGPVGSLSIDGASTIEAACLTGSGDFANTPIEPGFSTTKSGAVTGDKLKTTFTAGIVSSSSTVEMWIELDFESIVPNPDSARPIRILELGPNTHFGFTAFKNGGSNGIVFNAGTFSESGFQYRDGLMHIAIVYDHAGSNSFIYVNGSSLNLQQPVFQNEVLPEAEFIEIPFHATEDITVHSLALFDRTLSFTEIGTLFDAGIPPSLPVFPPNMMILEADEDTDILINPAALIAQTSDPGGSLFGIEIIGKRGSDKFPEDTSLPDVDAALPAVAASFTLKPEGGVSTYDPTLDPPEICGGTADSEYVIYDIATVPTGCEDGTGNNLCSISSTLAVCLKYIDDAAFWESNEVEGLSAAFNKWSPLAGLVPKDDDAVGLTLLVSDNPAFDIGYSEAGDCTGVVTIAKNGATATALSAAALDKALCYKSTSVFPEPVVADVGSITLTEPGFTGVDASFSVSVDFPYTLPPDYSVTLQEDGATTLTLEASDLRGELPSGYKFKITSLPTASSDYFLTSVDSETESKVSVGDTFSATSSTLGAPKLELYLHTVDNYYTVNALSVEFVVSNGAEVIPDSRSFTQEFTVAEVPDFVALSGAVATTTVFPHVFTPIDGLRVTDVDPGTRGLNVSISVSNGAVKYSGVAITAAASGCEESMSMECSECLFEANGCEDIEIVDTSDMLQLLFDGLALRNDAVASVSVEVTVKDVINENEAGEALYEKTVTINVSGEAAPSASPSASPTLSPSRGPTVTRAPSPSPSNSPSTASPTSEKSSGLGMGLLIGVTAGPVLALGGLAAFILLRRRRRNADDEPKTALVARPSDIESDNKYNGGRSRDADKPKDELSRYAAPPREEKPKSVEEPAEPEQKLFKPQRPPGPRPTTFKTTKKQLVAKNDGIFDWEKHVEKGTLDVYFFNPKTGQTQWDPPDVEVVKGGGKMLKLSKYAKKK